MVSCMYDCPLASLQVVGVLKGGSLTWIPAIYASAQQSALTSFYEQNGWMGYDTARRWVFDAMLQK